MSDARQTRYDRRRRSCRTNSEFDSIRGEYRFFECRKTGSQTESKNRFIRFFPYRYTTLATSEAFQVGVANVRAINVVNDCAERGVKLTSDFVTAARGEQHLQNVLQAVEHDRSEQPKLRCCRRKLTVN